MPNYDLQTDWSAADERWPDREGKMLSMESMSAIERFLENKYAGYPISESLRAIIKADGDGILKDAGFPHLCMSIRTEFNRATINFHYRNQR